MGTALAAIMASVLSPGKYGWLSTAFGVILICILAAHYRPEPAETFRQAMARAAAFGAVGALCFSLAAAWPIQDLASPRLVEASCIQHATADIPDVTWNRLPPDRVDVFEDCVGNVTTGRLEGVWLIATLVLTVFALLKWHRPALGIRSGERTVSIWTGG